MGVLYFRVEIGRGEVECGFVLELWRVWFWDEVFSLGGFSIFLVVVCLLVVM